LLRINLTFLPILPTPLGEDGHAGVEAHRRQGDPGRDRGYRQEEGCDPRAADHNLDGDEPMLGLYLSVAGCPPDEEGVVLPFARPEDTDRGDMTE
jgi:hypothetical protein